MTLITFAKRSLVLAAIAGWPVACGGDDSAATSSTTGEGSPCDVAGQSTSCECEGGGMGAQVCGEDLTNGPCVCAECGNGEIEAGEACDDTNLGGETCASLTMNARPNGTPSCSDTCQHVLTGCTSPPTSTGGTPGTTGGTGGTGGSTGGTMGGGGLTGSGGLMGGGGTSP